MADIDEMVEAHLVTGTFVIGELMVHNIVGDPADYMGGPRPMYWVPKSVGQLQCSTSWEEFDASRYAVITRPPFIRRSRPISAAEVYWCWHGHGDRSFSGDHTGITLVLPRPEDGVVISFEGATLEHSSLTFAKGSRVDCSGAKMAHAVIRGDDLTGSIFDDADLTGVLFDGCILDGCSFKGAILNEACFEGTRLERASFVDADARFADFAGADGMNAADFGGADTFGARW